MDSVRVVIVGGGFLGLNCAKRLGNKKNIHVTLVDRNNHHLFQPLLYQVAMAGLSPADIAVPIRAILRPYNNIQVYQAEVETIDYKGKTIETEHGSIPWDYLVVATGARHTYFGNEVWETNAPGLKTLSQATEIRRRVLSAFERAEVCNDSQMQKRLMTFIVVGGGPTGVELAGAIGEMSRHTLAKDFTRIDSTLTRVILIESGPRILSSFSAKLSKQAMRDLESMGVQVWTKSRVTHIDETGVKIGDETITAGTVLWAAGVQAARLASQSGWETDPQGRVYVNPDLSVPGYDHVFVGGDASCIRRKNKKPLPGLAPVAIQQGIFLAKLINAEVQGKKKRDSFKYIDKGQMATIGRRRAVLEVGALKKSGFMAWLAWLVVHVYYLVGFRNRFLVVAQWAWSYVHYRRGACLIVNRDWRFWKDLPKAPSNKNK